MDITNKQPTASERAVALLSEFSDQERREAIEALKDHYCLECGRVYKDKWDRCSCWNDE